MFLPAACVLALLAAPVGGKPSGRELAVIQQAPGFTLLGQDEKEVSLERFRGKVLLVSFVFTTCSGTCPATTHRMSRIQDALKRVQLPGKDRVHFLSISLDPERDTPAALRRYMSLYDVDPTGWTFLTGPAGEVGKVIRAWGMWARPAADGQLDHPSRIFLVDTRGRIREIYSLSFLKPDWAIEDIRLLLEEKQGVDKEP